MAILPLALLDEYYINYRPVNPVFRLNGKLKTIKSFKAESLEELRDFLSDKSTIYVTSLMHEVLDEEDGEVFILNAYIEGLVSDPDFPFINDEDTKFTVLSYVVNSRDDVQVESTAAGDKSLDYAIAAVKEVYQDHIDFKFLREKERLHFLPIFSY